MNKETIIIGISGASASGKTLIANTIVNELGSNEVVIISEDSYYKDLSGLSLKERERVNFDHPDSLDHALLFEHLQQLQQGQEIHVPIYNFATHLREQETRVVAQHHIVILEGILLFVEPWLRDIMDIKIFMDTSPDVCLSRRIRRDLNERGRSLESVLNQYAETVRPMYLQFIEPSKRYADIAVPRGGENRIAIDMVKAKIRELLNQAV